MFAKIKNLFSKDLNSGSELSLYKARNKTVEIVVLLIRYIILLSISYVVLYPLFYMISTSFRGFSDFYDPSVLWVPKEFTTQWYDWAINAMEFWQSLRNTIVFECIAAFLEIVSCSLIAYGLARFDFKGKNILLALLILIILVPDQLIIVPKIMNFANLDFLGIVSAINKIFGTEIKINILNTGFAFYLPSIFGVGLRSGIILFIYMQFYKGLPKELEEAAWIDGAGLFQTYTRIALPSSGVVITTVSIFSIIWHWNDYFLSVMFLNSASVMPLAVKISNIHNEISNKYSVWGGPKSIATQCAACVMFILPVLIMYIILQRKFVKSIDRVGITG